MYPFIHPIISYISLTDLFFFQVSDVKADGCKLKWEPPEDDGGEPIENYVVERMDTESGRWVPVCTTKTPEADVTGLNEGKDYLFRVKAVNPEGESEALVTDTATTAKNPYGEYFWIGLIFYTCILIGTVSRYQIGYTVHYW